MTVGQTRAPGDLIYHHFATKCSNVRPWLSYSFCLLACLLLFVSHQLPEVRWQWNGTVTDHSLFSKTMVRCGFFSPVKKRVNSNCPGWLSITSKINPRNLFWLGHWLFFLIWARVYFRSLSPVSKREGDEVEVRSYAVSFSSLEFLCSGWVSTHSLVGNWGHHLENFRP